MDLSSIVESIKKQGTLIKEPRRLRRKPVTDVAREARRERSAQKNRAYRRAWMALEESTVSGSWYAMCRVYARRAKLRKAKGLSTAQSGEWKLTLQDWQALWAAAGSIALPSGKEVLAFQLRGKYAESCKIWRIEPTKPWTLDNTIVLYKGQVLANGRKLCTIG